MHSTYDRQSAPLRRAIARTRGWLLNQQHEDGYWVAELEGDTILESEYILLLAWLGRADTPLARKLARHILNQQQPGGGWGMYPGGDMEISGSVKAYFALKLTGHDPAAEYMQRARSAILAHGGADAVNSFTRFYLALLGQIGYEQCPVVPPEMILLPKWFPVNIYAMSSWSRTIVIPLAIMSALKPKNPIDSRFGIRELFIRQPENWPPLRSPCVKRSVKVLGWERFFRAVDNTLKFCERHRLLPLRRRALAQAERWMIDRFGGSDGLGAIFPPMVWAVIALRSLGYKDSSPELRYCYERLEGLIIEEETTARLQPCKSPVWDTSIAMRALSASGLPASDAAIERSSDWLLRNQIHRTGDWANTVDVQPGGWCFEFANDYYPDLDDTAMCMMALADQFRAPAETPAAPGTLRLVDDQDEASQSNRLALLERIPDALARAERWTLAMQNRDGGWGAFDKDNDREFLCYVPFADHNAMIDPSTPDLTARVLEALGQIGHRQGNPAVDRALAYLRQSQEADGSWFGRWGVNYIYGTWQVLVGLRAVGVPSSDPTVVAGVNWLLAYQQSSGAWGESADSYADPHLRGQGPATPSQTAWALLGLIAAGQHDHPSVARGIQWLVNHQREDGGWDELEFTGTGFPQVFYLRYHMYPIYFPLMALSQWAAATGIKLPSPEKMTLALQEVADEG
ncbi:MAG: squalene--hopene cyclase [Planctomycetes bacterium]|nr:squalene--hopene cyclase [Planctomycetota bacterium]